MEHLKEQIVSKVKSLDYRKTTSKIQKYPLKLMGYNNKVTRTGLLTKNRLLSRFGQEPVVSYNNAILQRR